MPASGYCGLPVRFDDVVEDIDGYVDEKGLQPSGKWHCLADIGGALCLVEVVLRKIV